MCLYNRNIHRPETLFKQTVEIKLTNVSLRAKIFMRWSASDKSYEFDLYMWLWPDMSISM